MKKDEEKKAEDVEAIEVKPEVPSMVMSPEAVASRQLAHDIKVAKFLAGGK